MAKIFYNGNRIIVDGHADTPQECQAITAMCDSLANDENFKTIVYEKGHAVFERVDGGDAMMFAMEDYVLTSTYDSQVAYNALIVNNKGTVAKRMTHYDEDFQTLVNLLGTHLNWVYPSEAATENGILPRLEALFARVEALENKPTKTLPYTADELIAKLESI